MPSAARPGRAALAWSDCGSWPMVRAMRCNKARSSANSLLACLACLSRWPKVTISWSMASIVNRLAADCERGFFLLTFKWGAEECVRVALDFFGLCAILERSSSLATSGATGIRTLTDARSTPLQKEPVCLFRHSPKRSGGGGIRTRGTLGEYDRF